MKKLLNLKLLLFWNIVLTVLVILLFINFSRVADRQNELNSGLNVLLLDIDGIQTVMAEFIEDMETADSTMATLKKDIKEIGSDINSLGYDLHDQEMTINDLQSEVNKYVRSGGDLEDIKFDLEIEIDHLKSDIFDLDMALDDLKFDVDVLRDDVQYLLEQ